MATPEEIAAAQAAARAAANSMKPRLATGPGGLTPYSQPGLLPRMATQGQPSMGGMLAATPGIVQGVQQIASTVGGVMNTADAAMRSALMPSPPVTPGANINGYPNSYGGLPNPAAPPPPPLTMSPEMTVPNIGFNTGGNIIVGGRDKNGKANDFSGANIGANAAYVTPNGQGTTIGGTGARAGEAGIGPAQTRNAVGPAAGLVAPAAVPALTGAANATGTAGAALPQPTVATASPTSPAPQSAPQIPGLASSSSTTSQSGAVGFAGIPTSGAAFEAANAPYVPRVGVDMDPQIKRANELQDRQLALAQQAIALASTGNMSDAIMAKHIRSTIQAMSGVQSAGAGAVNPLLQTTQQAATTQRDTDVQSATNVATSNTQAKVATRGQDIESYFKLPAHVQTTAMAQLQAKAAAGDAAALETIRQITLAQDKAQSQWLGIAGNTEGIFQGGRWYKAPGSTPTGAPEIGADAARQRLGLVQPGVQ